MYVCVCILRQVLCLVGFESPYYVLWTMYYVCIMYVCIKYVCMCVCMYYVFWNDVLCGMLLCITTPCEINRDQKKRKLLCKPIIFLCFLIPISFARAFMYNVLCIMCCVLCIMHLGIVYYVSRIM